MALLLPCGSLLFLINKHPPTIPLNEHTRVVPSSAPPRFSHLTNEPLHHHQTRSDGRSVPLPCLNTDTYYPPFPLFFPLFFSFLFPFFSSFLSNVHHCRLKVSTSVRSLPFQHSERFRPTSFSCTPPIQQQYHQRSATFFSLTNHTCISNDTSSIYPQERAPSQSRPESLTQTHFCTTSSFSTSHTSSTCFGIFGLVSFFILTGLFPSPSGTDLSPEENRDVPYGEHWYQFRSRVNPLRHDCYRFSSSPAIEKARWIVNHQLFRNKGQHLERSGST